MRKYIIFISFVLLVLLFSCNVKENRRKIVLVELKSKIDKNIIFIDTLSLSGNLWSIGSPSEAKSGVSPYRISFLYLEKEELKIKNKLSRTYLNNSYVYLFPNDFIKLLYKSDRVKYSGINYKKEVIDKMFYVEYEEDKKNNYSTYPIKLNDEFIMILVHTNFYQELFYTNDWFCNDTYIKVITQNCLYYYDEKEKE